MEFGPELVDTKVIKIITIEENVGTMYTKVVDVLMLFADGPKVVWERFEALLAK